MTPMNRPSSFLPATLLYRIIAAMAVGGAVIFVAAMAFTTLKFEASPMIWICVIGLAISGGAIASAFPKLGEHIAYDSTKRRRRMGSRDIFDDIHEDIDEKYI